MHHILQERIRSALRLLAVRQFDVAQRTRRLLPLPWRNSKILKRRWAHFCAALRNGGDISARDQLKDGFDIGTASDVDTDPAIKHNAAASRDNLWSVE